MLAFPERILEGDVPNVDFLHLYGPVSLHVLAGWYGLFGDTLGVERMFGLLQHVALIFGMFALARAWGRTMAVVGALTATFLVLTPIGLSALAWEGGVALALWSVVLGVRALHTDAAWQRRAAARSPACSPGSPSATAPTSCSPWSWPTAGCCGARRRGGGSSLTVLVGLAVGLVPMFVHLVDGRAGEGRPGHGPRPRVRAAPRPRAAPPAVVGPHRRRAAGGRRGTERRAVVALPGAVGQPPAVPLVLRRDRRRARRGRLRLVVDASLAGAALRRAARRRAARPRHAPAGAAAPRQHPPRVGLVRVGLADPVRGRRAVGARHRPGGPAGARPAPVVGRRRGQRAGAGRGGAVLHVPLLPAATRGSPSATSRAAFEVSRGDRDVLLRQPAAAGGQPAGDRRPRPAVEARRAPARRAGRPAAGRSTATRSSTTCSPS